MERYELGDLIPGLPEELAMECVTRIPYTSHQIAHEVCRRWRLLFQSRDFYNHRRVTGHAHKVACLVQAHTPDTTNKSKATTSYRVVLFDTVNRTWRPLDPLPTYQGGLPLFCQLAGCDGKLVVMGGWDPITYDAVQGVFIYDFVTGKWKQGKPMPEKRSFFAIGSGSCGRVYVAGGHDPNKNALPTSWVYNVREDEWSPLPRMTRERDECEGFVVTNGEDGEEFWVISGYGSENQGRFVCDSEVYDSESGSWRLVEGTWTAGRCPRSSAGMMGGRVVCWGDLVRQGMKVGPCGLIVGDRVLVMASEGQGGNLGFYLVDGQDGKMEKIAVDDQFSGIVQSACSVEV